MELLDDGIWEAHAKTQEGEEQNNEDDVLERDGVPHGFDGLGMW